MTDVEPEPCRGCMTPIPPGWGWCDDCEHEEREAERAREAAIGANLPTGFVDRLG